MLVLLQWLWNYVTRGRSALLITQRDSAASRQTGVHPKLATDSGTWPLIR